MFSKVNFLIFYHTFNEAGISSWKLVIENIIIIILLLLFLGESSGCLLTWICLFDKYKIQVFIYI